MIKNKVEFFIKHNKLIRDLFFYSFNLIMKTWSIFIKTDKNLVLINSFAGKRFNDSPRAIFEYIISHDEYKNLKIVWAFESPEKYHLPCNKVKIDTIAYFFTALRAKYWITCVNIERGLHFKKKGTIYLNTWHGIPLKLVGSAVKHRKFNFSNINIFCCSGEYDRKIYIRDFNVKSRNILNCGLPRNDELYNTNENTVIKKRKELNIPNNKKIILYTPTWRESKDLGKSYEIAPPIDFSFWRKYLGNNYIILFRAHSFTTKTMNIKFNSFVHDYSSYNKLNDLLIVADVLISDYSSIIFDYSILERPILCFAYDYDEYTKERGFYFDLKNELPFSICKDEIELLSKIKTLDYLKESSKTATFKRKYLNYGGNATKMCVESLFKDRIHV